MKLEGYLKSFYEFSGKASDITRQLAFAGIAIIWLFSQGPQGQHGVPHSLHIPAIFLVLGLASDLLQYVLASGIWSAFHRLQENKGFKADDEVKAPSWLNSPVYFFFCLKILLIGMSYYFLTQYLIRSL